MSRYIEVLFFSGQTKNVSVPHKMDEGSNIVGYQKGNCTLPNCDLSAHVVTKELLN